MNFYIIYITTLHKLGDVSNIQYFELNEASAVMLLNSFIRKKMNNVFVKF